MKVVGIREYTYLHRAPWLRITSPASWPMGTGGCFLGNKEAGAWS